MLKHVVPWKVVQEQMMPNFNLERRGTQLKCKDIFFTAVNKERVKERRDSFCSFFKDKKSS